MALRLTKAFGGTAELWLRLQLAYDLAQAQKREAEITRDVRKVAMVAQQHGLRRTVRMDSRRGRF